LILELAGPKRACGDLRSRNDHLADWPQRETGELDMRPCERDADKGYSQHDCCDEMTERQPPTGEDKPKDIAKNAKRPSTKIVMSIGRA
jgi:hypothetical protein